MDDNLPLYTLTRTLEGWQGAFGKLLDPAGKQLCVTCERPWLDNIVGKSCIPPGTYNVIPHDSVSHPYTWEVTGVPGRKDILIHNGNTENDTEGCILVGDSMGTINGLMAVLNSLVTMQMLRAKLPKYFKLLIQ